MTVNISIPGYIERALQRFEHPQPSRPQHAPHAWQKPQYGATTQYAPSPDNSPALNASNTKHVQEVLGTLLFYALAIDSTMLVAISTLASQQTHVTKSTLEGLTHLLNYCATHPDAAVQFIASDMALHVKSDTSYLTAPKVCSRAASYHFLSSLPADPAKPPLQLTLLPLHPTAPLMFSAKSSAKSSPVPPKLSLPPFSTMAKMRALFAPAWKNLDIPNLPLPL